MNACMQEFMGVVLGSAVVPIALAVSWKEANKWGCVAGAVSGFCAGIIAWLVTTSALNGGVINVTVSDPGVRGMYVWSTELNLLLYRRVEVCKSEEYTWMLWLNIVHR